jgi:hypothetical protein
MPTHANQISAARGYRVGQPPARARAMLATTTADMV